MSKCELWSPGTAEALTSAGGQRNVVSGHLENSAIFQVAHRRKQGQQCRSGRATSQSMAHLSPGELMCDAQCQQHATDQ